MTSEAKDVTILAVSRRLDEVVKDLKQEIEDLELGPFDNFGLSIDMGVLEGVTAWLHEKAKEIAETQP